MSQARQGESEAVRHWGSFDVAKSFFDAALLFHGELGELPALSALPAKRFPRTREGARSFVAWLDERYDAAGAEGPVRCVMETTGRYSVELAVWLLEQRPSLAPAIVHAKYTADFIKSLGVRNHTDTLAARALAIYGLQRQPKAFEPPSKKERELRDVCRHRHALVGYQTSLKNQIQEGTESAFMRREQAKRLRQVARDIERAEKEMKRLLDTLPAIKADVEVLKTIYGVGFIVATTVRTELGDLTRFDKARQLSAHAGVNPTQRQSGSSVRGRTRMSKQGNKRARHALYMAAQRAIRGDNDFAREYRQQRANGKTGKAALGVIMRKMLVLMRTLLIHRQPYDPNHKFGGKPCGKENLEAVIRRTAEAMSL